LGLTGSNIDVESREMTDSMPETLMESNLMVLGCLLTF